MIAADGEGPDAGRGGVVAGAEVQGFQAGAGGGDGADIFHAECRFDEHLDTDALRSPFCRLDLGEQHVDRVDVGGVSRLRDHDQVEPLARLLDDVDHVAVHERRIEAVDAYRQRAIAPVEVIDRGDNIGARPLLLADRDRIFQIEQHDIGGEAARLVDEARIRGGDGELRAVRADRPDGGLGQAHDGGLRRLPGRRPGARVLRWASGWAVSTRRFSWSSRMWV